MIHPVVVGDPVFKPTLVVGALANIEDLVLLRMLVIQKLLDLEECE